jgi:MFS family permease
MVKRRSPVGLIIVSTAAVGAAYLGMAVAGTLLVACLFSILGGAGNGVQWISVMTALQEATPVSLQARVTGLLESIGAAVPGIGFLIGGALATLGTPRTAYAVAGAGVMVLVVVALVVQARMQVVDRGPRNGLPVGEVSLPDPRSHAASHERS